MWSLTFSTPACFRFWTGPTVILFFKSLLLLNLTHCGVIFMKVWSGVVTGPVILSAGFDVVTQVTTKGALCCDVTSFHCAELRHCFQNEKPSVPLIWKVHLQTNDRTGSGIGRQVSTMQASPFFGTLSASESRIVPQSLLPCHKKIWVEPSVLLLILITFLPWRRRQQVTSKHCYVSKKIAASHTVRR